MTDSPRPLVAPEIARAAWLQLDEQPMPVYVAESRTGYMIGSLALCALARARRPAVLAGYFCKGVEFDDFAEDVEAAAREVSQ